jgi:hypothetical protein
MAGTLPAYDQFGIFGSNPSGASVNNPLVGSPQAGSAGGNPLIANPGAGTAVASAPATDPNYQYNVTPGNQSGSGPFGGVPGTVALPQPYADLSSVFPDLGQANQDLSSNILSELEGGLSPGTLDALGQAQDAFGIKGPINTSPMSLGTTSTALESQGVGNWAGLLPSVSTTQTVSPEVEAQIAEFNAQQAAAANPTSSAAAGIASSAVGAILSKIL